MRGVARFSYTIAAAVSVGALWCMPVRADDDRGRFPPTAGARRESSGSVGTASAGGPLGAGSTAVAVHVHEFGDCTASDTKSAGEHFAPEGDPHGGPRAPAHHAGDLGNLEADATGKAHLDLTVDAPERGMLLGRAVIVHQKEDDLESQPSGNAGARIACGVIGTAKDAPGGGG